MHPPLHRSYTGWWLVLFVVVLAVEVVALSRARPGDTLSEHVWRLIARPVEGPAIFGVLGWLFLWHFPFGHGRRLGWLDVAAVLLGVAWWGLARWIGGGARG